MGNPQRSSRAPIELVWPSLRPQDFVPDAAQQAVIDHDRGHLRVLAGPGTGKTSVIVASVQRRIQQGQPVGEILVLTYGRMAAEELRQRLSAGGEQVPIATTFHALAYRLLQASEPGLRLMGAPEQEAVVREIVGLSPHLPASLEPARHSRGLSEQLRAYIAEQQSRGLAPTAGIDEVSVAAQAIYADYLDVTGLASAMDYSELIRRAARLLAEDPPDSVRRLRAIYVDEYQDTDPSQVAFLEQLASHGAQIIAVGDPDQSIYGFRGADAEGILRFHERFSQPSCTTVALGATRRFGEDIAAVARAVVPRNALGSIPARAVHAHRNPLPGGPQGAVAFRQYESEAAQADHIADLLRRVQAGSSQVFPGLQLDWSQMAVLVRSGARDLPALQRALTASGVPCEIVRDDLPVVKAASVRPFLDVLRCAADLDGGLTGQRVVDLLCSPLIGMQSRQVHSLGRALRREAAQRTTDALPMSTDLIAAAVTDPEVLAAVSPEFAEPVTALAELVEGAHSRVEAGWSVPEVLSAVWQATDWPRRLRREALGGGRRAREAHQALDAAMELFDQAEQMDAAFERVGTVEAFLAHLENQAIPAAADRQRGWNREAVRLLTAHRSKGSQWPLVVVAGVQDGLWPDLRPRPNLLKATGDWRDQQLLDERRLFFVACTRASKALVIATVSSASEDGPKPSPFVALAAGQTGIVEVHGRPQRPLTPTGVVAGLRQTLLDAAASPALKRACWERLEEIGQRTDAQGRRVFPWAQPTTWWGHRAWTDNGQPWHAPNSPLTLSPSSVQQYVDCPRKWFLERKAKAGEAASTKMAFGTLLHLCAEAIATGDVKPDEAQIDEVLDGVWAGVGYEPGWQQRYEREEARAATRRLLRWMAACPGEFVAAEKEFRAEIVGDGDETVVITGKVDRVDQVDEKLLITDFKTGKPIAVKAGQDHVQLGLYRWAAELGALGAPQDAVAQLLYVRHDPPGKQADMGARIISQDSPDVAAWLGPVVDAAAAGLRAEISVARPGSQCRTCVVCSSCPAVPQGMEVRP